jgi:hypothetical protein
MDKWQALQTFWASFDLEAIDNTILLDNETREELGIAFPYITYEASLSDFDEPLALTASLWYHSLSWGAISQKADEIGNALGLGGVKVPYDGGQMWIQRGTPFSQRMSDPDRYIRRIVLNIVIEFL